MSSKEGVESEKELHQGVQPPEEKQLHQDVQHSEDKELNRDAQHPEGKELHHDAQHLDIETERAGGQAVDLDETAKISDYKADAIEAENAEHDMTVLEAVRAYPMASFWAFVMSFTIVSCLCFPSAKTSSSSELQLNYF